jgi:hypothetical protein
LEKQKTPRIMHAIRGVFVFPGQRFAAGAEATPSQTYKLKAQS